MVRHAFHEYDSAYVCGGGARQLLRHVVEHSSYGSCSKLTGRKLKIFRLFRHPIRVQGFVRPEDLLKHVFIVFRVFPRNIFLPITPAV